MYPSITSHHAQTVEGRSGASLPVSAACDPSASRRSPRIRLASTAEVLWRSAEATGVTDAMIEAISRHIQRYWILRPLCHSISCSTFKPLNRLRHTSRVEVEEIGRAHV